MFLDTSRGCHVDFMIPIAVGAELTSRTTFRDAMNKLWDDHVAWTRLYIVSAAADLPDKDQTAQRLLQNQTDIGNAIKPFYGDAAGEKRAGLLKDHIMISTEVIAAAKAGDSAKKDEAAQRWSANADEIASFLSGANPKNWPAGDMKTMMHDHLDLTTNEAVARLQGDWAADIAAYDKVHEQILKMADMLSEGNKTASGSKSFCDKAFPIFVFSTTTDSFPNRIRSSNH